MPLTVVIPTLGGSSLSRTLEWLNRGSVIPNEILVCIPQSELRNVAKLSFPNVSVVVTSHKGQVVQRAAGFARASYSHVMQLDDDMLVDRYCVEHLLDAMATNGGNVAVAPSLLCISNGQPFYRAPKNKVFLTLYYWLLNGMCGYRPGTVTKAGTNVGIDPTTLEENTVEVEWLPGGCVMHRRDNLILENFYPFNGKAYCEDLYHSYYLKRRGLRLAVCTTARCFVDDAAPFGDQSLRVFFRNVLADLRARRHLVHLSARSVTRMYFYYAVIVLRYLFGKSKRSSGLTAT